jgi:hypothetical protein
MLGNGINDVFKFSPNPDHMGRNCSMEIVKIMDQLMMTYGQPAPITLLQNDTLFCNVYSPHDAPKILFRRIEDCQEIQTLRDDQYTLKQLLNNAIRLLLGCGHYHRNFEEWDQKDTANKIWINLKPFIQEAYQRCLNTMDNTAGQHRYVQIAFATLEELEDNDDNIAIVMTQMAALTTSQLTTASLAAMSSSVMLAINQLAANQQAMMQQMMAYASTSRNPPPATTVPVTQFTIPAIGKFSLG